MIEIPEGVECVRCRVHQATTIWAGEAGLLAAIHGDGEPFCECCALAEQIRYGQEAALRVQALIRERVSSACKPFVLPLVQDHLVRQAWELRNALRREWQWAHTVVCGNHYPGRFAVGDDGCHPEGEHCYHPKPELLT